MQGHFEKQDFQLMKMMRKLQSDESGQTIVIAAIALMVLLSSLGLAIDVGRLRYVKRSLQTAADAAALAAGLEIRVCGSLTSCPAMQTAAAKAVEENGITVNNFVYNCGPTPATGVTLTINRPACALGTGDPNATKKPFAEAVITSVERTYFSRLIGWDNVRISARAEAGRTAGPCIYALDPTGPQAIAVLAGIGINANCTIVDESSSPAALTCIVGALITAPKVNVTGGTAGLLCGLSTTPRTGVPVPTPADPLAYLPKPAVGACGTSTGSPYTGSSSAVNIVLGLNNVTFNPGVYCGGISITAGLLMNVTFNPGVYVLKTGPGLLGIPSGGLNITVAALSTIQGSGVTFYNYGPVGGMSVTVPAALGLTNFNLSAPTSGTYSGVLFFQDPGNTTTDVFLATLLQTNRMEGAIYAPTAQVSYGVNALSTTYNVLVAKDIAFNIAVLSNFGSDFSNLDTGSPIGGDDAVLIQ